jgi:hypothetical protein
MEMMEMRPHLISSRVVDYSTQMAGGTKEGQRGDGDGIPAVSDAPGWPRFAISAKLPCDGALTKVIPADAALATVYALPPTPPPAAPPPTSNDGAANAADDDD